MTDYEWDKKLKIMTAGSREPQADNYHFPYEPTPYSVLERLAESGYIGEEQTVVDYGCGKGRVDFFLSAVVGCRTVGVEYDEKIYRQALQNQVTSGRRQKTAFVCRGAEVYEVQEEDCFYFFNPFSIEILRSVIGRILDSWYTSPRMMRLFFYYPNDEYISYLMTVKELSFLDEIDCQDLFPGNNKRERILIFEMQG